MMRTEYEDRCAIHNTDHDKTVEVAVMDFKPEARLTVSVQNSVKLVLTYIYVGSQAGMEFTSQGPRGYTVKDGRG
jgi:hypothetical protein